MVGPVRRSCLTVCRSLWVKVVEKSKATVVQEQALKDVDGAVQHMTSLSLALKEFVECERPSPELCSKVDDLISKCNGVSATLAACKSTEKPEAQEKSKAMEEVLEKVREQVNTSLQVSAKLAAFLNSLWVPRDGEGGNLLRPPVSGIQITKPDSSVVDINLEEYFSRIGLEGRFHLWASVRDDVL